MPLSAETAPPQADSAAKINALKHSDAILFNASSPHPSFRGEQLHMDTALCCQRLAKSHRLGRMQTPGDELSHPLPLHAAAPTACKGTAELLNGLETSLMVKCQHISRLIKPGAWEERERRLAVLETGMDFTAREHFKARKYFFIAKELQILRILRGFLPSIRS